MINKEKYLGIFDSGIGGLTVVKALLDKMPNENIVYLGDLKYMPYGDKTNEEITGYVLNDVNFLNNYDLKAVIVACNTADAVASTVLKEKYNFPIFGVIDPTVKQAIKTTKNNKIGIIATSATIKSNEYQKRINIINPNIEVFNKACPFLTPMIEQGKFVGDTEEIKIILENYISDLINKNIDTLILGCTHYELVSPIINEMYPELNIVSSSKCVLDDVYSNIEMNDSKLCQQLYFATADREKMELLAEKFLGNIEVNGI